MSESISTGEPEFAAFIAIDWADREHAWALAVAGGTDRERGTLEHTPEAIAAWALQWVNRFGNRPVAVALEQSRGALVYALSQYQHLVLYPIHPSTSHRYRQAMFPSGSKDDPKDADLLLDLLTRHRDRLRPLHPDTEATRKLQALVEKRRQLVDEKTAQKNRITDLLKLYFPQALGWFDTVDSPLAIAFLQRWPTLSQLQEESAEAVAAFFRQYHCRRQATTERLAQIQQARAAVTDAAVVEPAVLHLGVLVKVVETLRDGIAALERAIDAVAAAHPDYSIFASFPAAGPTMAPRLLAAFGSQRDRYPTAQNMQSFSGIAPVQEASGSRQWVHFRWAAPKFLRQTFHEYAGLSITRCDWAKDFYQQQRAKGKEHHAAVRSLAFKWLRILYRCWKSRIPYQDDIYRAARPCRPPEAPAGNKPQPPEPPAPPLPSVRDRMCDNPVEFQFKMLGGFWKLDTGTP